MSVNWKYFNKLHYIIDVKVHDKFGPILKLLYTERMADENTDRHGAGSGCVFLQKVPANDIKPTDQNV